ncbi:MAG TPA: YbjN domain-containing protein [Acidimicrobiia bacterium]|nr:YbjN domain-containing protein [Acidimicrobiia bacterium]
MRSDTIRPYLEQLIGRWLQMPVVGADGEGRYHVRVGTSGFFVEVVDFEPVLVRVWSPVVIRVDKTVELLDTLNALNGSGVGLRVFHRDREVILATELVAETLDDVELDFACHMLAGAAERLGPELVARFGGETLFDRRHDMAGEPEGISLFAAGGSR